MTARAILTRSVVHIPDCLTDPEYELTDAARASSNRSVLAVPMHHEGEIVGAVTVSREEPKPFIANENVRLFKELEARNRDLTATSEILRVISSSQRTCSLSSARSCRTRWSCAARSSPNPKIRRGSTED